MEFSDRVDTKNAQVYSITPSELGDRVDWSRSQIFKIVSYWLLYNAVFIWKEADHQQRKEKYLRLEIGSVVVQFVTAQLCYYSLYKSFEAYVDHYNQRISTSSQDLQTQTKE